jgi:hypothetical protein
MIWTCGSGDGGVGVGVGDFFISRVTVTVRLVCSTSNGLEITSTVVSSGASISVWIWTTPWCLV